MNFLNLRPKTETPADLVDALEKARIAETSTLQAAAQARLVRDDLLLSDDHQQLAVAERQLAEATSDIDRAQAIVARLEARLTQAESAERISKVGAAAQAADAADAALRKWWEKHQPVLRKILSEGQHLTVTLLDASMGYERLRMLTAREHPDLAMPERATTHGEHREWYAAVGRLIAYGVAAPRPSISPGAAEAVEEAIPASNGPGTLVMAAGPELRGAGDLVATYGPETAEKEDAA
jgi:hypothetical protein